MLLMGLDITLFRYLTDGPFWSQTGVEKDYCRDTWWTSLLFINNLVDPQNMVTNAVGLAWMTVFSILFFSVFCLGVVFGQRYAVSLDCTTCAHFSLAVFSPTI